MMRLIIFIFLFLMRRKVKRKPSGPVKISKLSNSTTK